MNSWSILGLATALVAVAGCFDEPQPAFETVPAETQVYLKDKGLETLTPEAVLKDGLVFIDDLAGCSPARRAELTLYGVGAVDDPRGGYTNLSARVTTFEPASLTYLNLDYNALTNVDALAAFTGLKWLRLNHNRLAALPDLSALTELRRLYLRGNRFTDESALEQAIKPGALAALDTLDLSGNQLTRVPAWLAERTGLIHLNLSETGITELPADLTPWRTLKTLQLGGLKMKSFEEMQRIRAALPETTIVF